MNNSHSPDQSLERNTAQQLQDSAQHLEALVQLATSGLLDEAAKIRLIDAARLLRSQAGAINEPSEMTVFGIQDWSLYGEPDESAPAFDLKISPSRSGASIEIFEANANRSEDLPRMSFLCEINNGVPTLHVHSMDNSDVARTFYAKKDGSLLERPGDAEVTLVDPQFLPDGDRCEYDQASSTARVREPS